MEESRWWGKEEEQMVGKGRRDDGGLGIADGSRTRREGGEGGEGGERGGEGGEGGGEEEDEGLMMEESENVPESTRENERGRERGR